MEAPYFYPKPFLFSCRILGYTSSPWSEFRSGVDLEISLINKPGSGWFLHRSLSTPSDCLASSFIGVWECVVPWIGPGLWNLSHPFCTRSWTLRPSPNTCANRGLFTKWLPKPAVSLPALVCQTSKFWGTTAASVLHVSQATQPGEKRVTMTIIKQTSLILPPRESRNPCTVCHVPPFLSSCCDWGLLLLWGPASLQVLFEFMVTWVLSHHSKVTKLWAGVKCKWHTPANPRVLFREHNPVTVLSGIYL